jgi:hypothetical protein
MTTPPSARRISLCGGRETAEIREPLLGRELDPMVVPVSAEAALRRRCRRIRSASIVTAAVVAVEVSGIEVTARWTSGQTTVVDLCDLFGSD